MVMTAKQESEMESDDEMEEDTRFYNGRSINRRRRRYAYVQTRTR